ncbi:MAG: protein-disulfide reductase DsbD family protein [Chthoniobacterales bacterium]
MKNRFSWKLFGSLFALACFLNNLFGAPQNQPVKASLIASTNLIEAGKPFDVYLVLVLEKGWHTYSEHPGDAGFPPRVAWQLPTGWLASPLEFSVSQKFSEPGGLTIDGYEHRALFRAKITPSTSLEPASFWQLSAKISWLACSDTLCVPGSSTISINVGKAIAETQEQTALLKSISAPIIWKSSSYKDSNFRNPSEVGCNLPAALERTGIRDTSIPAFTGMTYTATQQVATKGTFQKKSNLLVLLLALGSGLLGGLILNLMPCVLPVISLKIFGFISQAGERRQKILRHGLAFAAGIYFWFLGLGTLVIILKNSGIKVTWAFQFQSPTFLLTISVLIFLFALNLFGVFEITLPSRTGSSLDQLGSRNGYLGSFFQGLFATLLATPCTAPFLGSALGFAFAQPGSVIMAMFVAIATGMATPYLLLSAQPGWMRCLPRPGVWMERIKQLMGFPLLATNLWLLAILGLQRGSSSIIMTITLLLLLSLSAWIYGSFYSSKKSIIAIALSFCIAASSLYYYFPKILSTSNVSSYSTRLESPDESSELPATVDAADSQPTKSTEVTTKEIAQNKISWVPYSKASLEQIHNLGRPVFIDFTAAWCLTCQFNERTAINTTAVRALLKKENIVAMKADWTKANAEITQALQDFGRVGVPYYVFYPAGKNSKPIMLSELLTEAQVIKALSSPEGDEQ